MSRLRWQVGLALSYTEHLPRRKLPYYPEGYVLVEKQVQEAILILCSLSAAKDKQAVISSCVNSG